MFAHSVVNQMTKYVAKARQASEPGQYDEYLDKLSCVIPQIVASMKYHLGRFEMTIGDKVDALLKTHMDKTGELPRVFKTLHEFIVAPYPLIWVDWISQSGEKFGAIVEHRTNNKSSEMSILNIISFISINDAWFFNPAQCRVLLTKNGVNNQVMVYPYKSARLSETENIELEKVFEKGLRNAAEIIYMLFLFLNCKNVITVDKPASRLMHQVTKKGKQAPFTYKTLVVTDTRKQNINKHPSSGVSKGIRSLHDVQSHVARYYPERPLFGIPGNHGLFVISAHKRGNPVVGTVYKDYIVE